MSIRLASIDNLNKVWINRIYAGDSFSQFVHYNAHWFGQSILCDKLDFKLIYVDSIGSNDPVGLVCYGQSYVDIYMQNLRPNKAEIYHVVIHHTQQRKGYGRMAIKCVIDELQQVKKFRAIVVAFHPDNQVAEGLYRNLNFIVLGRNSEDDVLLSLVI